MRKPKAKASKTAPIAPPDALRLEYVPVATAVAWERNPKKHDVGALWQSIQQHGFKDPPKFEPALNGGRGGIVEGNGRSHVLREMQAGGEAPPRGILLDAGGDWLMPVLFGVDAGSERAAEAYGVDHNNLVLSGGDFGPLDMVRLWDEAAYAELLSGLANEQTLPVSVDGDDVDALIARLASEGQPQGDGHGGGYESFSQQQDLKNKKPGAGTAAKKKISIGVFIICENEAHQREVLDELQGQDYECKALKAYV